MDTRPLIAITMGDPAGIGPEVIVKGLRETSPGTYQPVVVGDARFLQKTADCFTPGLAIHSIQTLDLIRFQDGILNVLDLENIDGDLPLGRPSAKSGQASYEYIHRAVDLALNREVQAITTAPINKEALHLAGHPFPGHTELLAELTGTSEVALMLAGDSLRVVLTTTHVALHEVRNLITRDRVLQTLRLTHEWLRRMGIDAPHIAVTGLNPHCGDGGIFGQEERDHIIPAVESAREEGIHAVGPQSADALFGRLHKSPCDAVVTMYHDQGMIPIKMASMGQAVNITLGLPIIRTSVDHGTAYDIAGQGFADPESLLHALKMAASLTSHTPTTS